MKSRVSTSRVPSVKFLISTVPGGNCQSPSASTVMSCPFGSPIQRFFTAPSDQKAAVGA